MDTLRMQLIWKARDFTTLHMHGRSVCRSSLVGRSVGQAHQGTPYCFSSLLRKPLFLPAGIATAFRCSFAFSRR